MNLFSNSTQAFSGLRSATKAVSKTACNFTGQIEAMQLPDCVSVNLDWFHFSADCNHPEPKPDEQVYWLTDSICLQYQNRGTPIYNYSYVIILHGEPVANLHTHSKNPKIVKAGKVKIELHNHILYTTEWQQIMDEICQALGATPTVYGRIDIAIDGVNHLFPFLNIYVKQKRDMEYMMNGINPGNNTMNVMPNYIAMKGKARVDAKVLTRGNMLFQNFKIGNSDKVVSIYNKSQEIDRRSNKEYIRRVWQGAGLDTTKDVWRCELRMKSGAIKNIKDFNFRRLQDPFYLLQIFKTQIENFFEFVFTRPGENISRAKKIDLFNFNKLRITCLDKIKRTVQRGAYKAKMAIHNGIANILLQHTKGEAINHALNHIADQIHLYDLGLYYKRKLGEWCKMYQLAPISKESSGKHSQTAAATLHLLDMDYWDKCRLGVF